LSEAESKVTLEVRRGDSVFGVPTELGARVDPNQAEPAELRWRADPVRSRAGWLGGHGGVVLVTSAEDGPFSDAGIEPGSVVLAIEGEPVRSDRALVRRLAAEEPGARVDVLWRAQGDDEERTTTVRLHAPPRRVTS